MAIIPIAAMVRKDLQIFVSDRRAVIMAIVVPIVIASFFGSVLSGADTGDARIPVLVVDQDGGVISKAIVQATVSDPNLVVRIVNSTEARDAVRRGSAAVAVIIPKGFGDAAGRAFFSREQKPELQLLYDPSRTGERAMVRGMLTGHVMEAVGQEMFSGERGQQLVDEALASLDASQLSTEQTKRLRDMLASIKQYYNAGTTQPSAIGPGLTVPFTAREEAVTARENAAYNGYAHSFAGMGVQFILFAAIDLGVGVLLERQRGLWKRLRSAPISRFQLLIGKVVSGAVIGLFSLVASFAFAMIVWGVRIDGSIVGFVAVALAFVVMASTFGLLLAAVGNTPSTTRGVASLATLVMVMLGGAWVPTFVFPSWLQQATLVVPTRWAVDGFDAMTWRGVGASGAVMPVLVMLGFAALFALVAVRRFRWEES
jgi:ABC-2 type transport system permease protein